MTAFGGVFRGPKIEGVEGSEDNGERGRVLGLDLESGVVRVQAPRRETPETEETEEAADPPAE